jgi:uncharacterized membrane protein YesL
VGVATTALYYTTLKLAEDRGSSVIKSFFHAFKDNFKQGTLIWLIVAVLISVMGADFYIMNQMDAGVYQGMKALLIVPAVVIAFTTAYVFPLLARFDNTIKNTLRNAFLLSVSNLPKTIAVLIIDILPIGVLLFSFKAIPVIFFIGFAGAAYLNSMIFLKIFDKITLPQEEGESEIE